MMASYNDSSDTDKLNSEDELIIIWTDDEEEEDKKGQTKGKKRSIMETSDVDSKEEQPFKLVKEMQTEFLAMKTILENQSKKMADLKKTGTLNDKSISILFAKVNQEKTERQEEMKEMREGQEISLKETKDRLAGASRAMANVVRATFEEEKKKEIKLINEKHDEEISGLKKQIEMLEEELKQSQKSNTSLEDRLKNQKEIEEKQKRLSQNNDSLKQEIDKLKNEIFIRNLRDVFAKMFKEQNEKLTKAFARL